MTYKRYLVFAWNLAEEPEGISNDNPLDKIKVSCETPEEADAETLELLDYDFITVFDCVERKTVSELDNIPF